MVDLAEVCLEAFDAFEKLATAKRAVAVTDVAAELVVVVGAVFGGGLDDDGTVGEAGCCDVAEAVALLWGSGRGGTVGRSVLFFLCFFSAAGVVVAVWVWPAAAAVAGVSTVCPARLTVTGPAVVMLPTYSLPLPTLTFV